MKTIRMKQNGSNKLIKTLLALLLLVSVIGCSNDDEGTEVIAINSEGSMQEVRSFYNDGFVDTMEALGFKINLGAAPPSLNGSYLISPFVLENSNIESDSDNIGQGTGEYQATFSNQENSTLSIDFSGGSETGVQTDIGKGSFITGSNGAFTVYAKTITQIGSSPATTAVVVTGIITSNGIEDVQFLGAMLDDNGDPQGVYIANNSGRLYNDGDGLASKQN